MKKSIVILMLIVTFLFSSKQVFAQDGTYAIHIEFSANNRTKPIEGVGFKAIRFMDINYHVEEGWNEEDVQFEKIFDDPINSAMKLKEIEKVMEPKAPELTGKTDANGKLDFTGIPSGYYLVFQTDQEGDGKEYNLSPPTIIGVPYLEDGVEKNEILIYPKTVPIVKATKPTPEKETGVSGGAQTGDDTIYYICAILFTLVSIVLFIIGNRRRAHYEK